MEIGCIENHSAKISTDIKTSPMDSVMSSSKIGKSKGTKDVLNKCASQIRKPARGKTSPLNWVLRKKGDSYLERKIKLLQQVDGMNLSLDETLGDSNPHYSRVLREKIAIREAAEKAMEARKAAMVEASWCRILRAARIESKEAEAELARAEKRADEAFEAATAVGVIMNVIPNRAKNMETTTSSRVTATFETGFEVDKQVAAAVKAAFIELASSPLTDKDVFIELLHKISQNPDMDENCRESTDFTLEFNSEEEKKCKKRQVIDKFHRDNLVEMMLDRLRLMEENELASLATIVATCGLNAALAEAENDKREEGTTKRTSSVHMRTRRGDEVEVPRLDKFLVKRMTKLEREVLEAKNGEKASTMTVKCKKQEFSDVPSLDKVLVKRMSRLEREVKEARSKRSSDGRGLIDKENRDLNKSRDKNVNANLSVEEVNDKIVVKPSMRSNGNCSTDCGTLDSVLVKHVSRLEREKTRYNTDGDSRMKLKRKDIDRGLDSNVSSLDQVLVKRKCRIEREKMAVVEVQEDDHVKQRPVSRREAREREMQEVWGGLSLGNSIRPHVSRLERDKAAWIKAEEERRRGQ